MKDKIFKELTKQGFLMTLNPNNVEIYSKEIEEVAIMIMGDKKGIYILGQKKQKEKTKALQCKVAVPFRKIKTESLQLLSVNSAIDSIVYSINNYKG